MIRLNSTIRKLQLGFDSSVSAGAVCIVSFFDTNMEGAETPGSTQITIGAGTADLDICAAPKQNFIRNIDAVDIFNSDSGPHTLAVKIDESGADATIVQKVVASKGTLHYEHNSGWTVV